jgi:hypothetical protein
MLKDRDNEIKNLINKIEQLEYQNNLSLTKIQKKRSRVPGEYTDENWDYNSIMSNYENCMHDLNETIRNLTTITGFLKPQCLTPN